ncbi:unnamed protein product [Brachionus calyciflorus]|uniref:Cyclin N-terminal domain-containing protein n=1 Tax=Brachionus calyciflorus TaxID=104777 RepID=A0A814D334_9BILA|nr:unnamed protein product [Brachionus calyciflorus]
MKSSKRVDNKKSSCKFKALKQRTFATNYLANISLNVSNENQVKNNFYESLINKDDFNCFLSFNRIENTREKQNEFFNYYKQKLSNDNNRCSKMNEFLIKEFNSTIFVPHVYIESILLGKTNRIPEISIQPSLSMSREVIFNKLTVSDVESEYLKSHKDKDNLKSNLLGTSNVTLSSNSSISTSIPNNTKFTKSLTNKSTKAKKANENLTIEINTNRNIKRTISESSNESSLNTSMTRNNILLASNRNSKPSLFNNLKRLTNEKIILTTNNSPIGVFSRLPFRFSTQKSDLNESLILKNRHASTNKNNLPQNNFIYDVFALLGLDFDDYISSGSMSYTSLIDPKSKHVQKKLNEDNQVGQLSEKMEEKNESDDDSLDNKFLLMGKKDLHPFNLESYKADYLDDPQLTEMTAGKNRTCLKFASYAVSIIDYVKPLDLKKEINETFKEKFPYIQITLTKLRSIKREMMEIAYESSLDFIIVAQAYIYFEKLILQGLINKSNRKFLAANCLIIGAKLNDVTKKDINKLIDNITNKFRFDNRKDVVLYEFPILVSLEFNLIIKYESEFLCHYERLMNNFENLKLNNNNNTNSNNYQTESNKLNSLQRTLSD